MNKGYFIFFFCCIMLVLLMGMPIDVMEVDAAQYASISMEMSQNGQYLEVLHRGKDYLDKPPLLFWTSAWSYLLFGVNEWGYKFFSFLVMLLGGLSVIKFTRLFYDQRTSLVAGTIYFCNIAVLLITNDVRTDTLLMGWCAFSIWMSAAYIQLKAWKYIFGLGLGVGMALLSKGPIGLMLPISAIGLHLILTKQWHKIFDPKWLVAFCVMLAVIVPMVFGLYHQFDLHPEKIVHGRTDVSGLYFFFWEQSFGRLTGENVWQDDSGYGYFFHTFLWAFIPWIFAFLFALGQFIKSIFKKRKLHLEEYFSIAAIVVPFIALSFSHYKLPHYIFIVIPFASIITARFLCSFNRTQWKESLKYLFGLQWFLFLIGIVFACLISLWAFPQRNIFYWILLLMFTLIPAYVLKKERRGFPLFLSIGVSTMLIIGLTMNLSFYPKLMTYQSSSQFGKYLVANKIDLNHVYAYNTHGHGLDFYAGQIIQDVDEEAAMKSLLNKKKEVIIYTNEMGYQALNEKGFETDIIMTKPHFKVTKLSLKFINPNTRYEAYEKAFLINLKSDL